MVEDNNISSPAIKQSNNKYSRGILIFLFFWYIVGPVIDGLINFIAGIIGTDVYSIGPWINLAGSLIGIALGIFFAIKRIRTNVPWKMTAYSKALMFGCFYFVFQQTWMIILFGVGELLSPSKALTSILPSLTYVIRFPSAFLGEGYWAPLMDSVIWATGFYLILKIIEKKKSGRPLDLHFFSAIILP
jgi:hypothetical protein